MVQILKKSSTSLFLSGFFSRRLFHASTRIFLRRGRKFTLEAAKQTQIHHEILEMNETCTFLWTLRILGPSKGRVWTYIAGVFLGPQNDAIFEGSGFLGNVFFFLAPPNNLIPRMPQEIPFFGGGRDGGFKIKSTNLGCFLLFLWLKWMISEGFRFPMNFKNVNVDVRGKWDLYADA